MYILFVRKQATIEFKSVSVQATIELKSISVQTDETAMPCTVKLLKKENKVLKQRVKRQTSYLSSLKDVLKTLRDEKLVSKDYEEYLTSQFEGKKIVCEYS